MKQAIVLIAFVSISALAYSATIYVPDDYTTIQGAIDASANGDTVIVRAGLYVENIDFAGKAITVQSEQGASVTTIDGNQAGSVVTFTSGEGFNSVLEGFTITNGTGGVDPWGNLSGGGIYCYYSSSTISNNTFTGNSADIGGGISTQYSSPAISNNIISGNDVQLEGGGIHCYRDLVGGIDCHGRSSATITNNTISGNTAYKGGGIYCQNSSSPTIANNSIADNRAEKGGAIYCLSTSPNITNNTITGNTGDKGGGIFCSNYTHPIITNNRIIGNSTVETGGGIECNYKSYPTITNNTIAENLAGGWGGGVYCVSQSTVTITNTILYDNSAPEGPEIYGGSPSVTYCDVKGGWSGTGNIDSDPLLIHSHIPFGSPCMNAGTNSAPDLPATDYDGDPRIVQGTADIGADEFYYHLFHKGAVVPGSTIEIFVVGLPNQSVVLAQSDSIQDPPVQTRYGDLYLSLPLTNQWNLPGVWSCGFTKIPVTVPANWVSGEEHYFQALVGPRWGPYSTDSQLTNLMFLTVE